VALLEIAVLIDLPETQPSFVATLAALDHAAAARSLDVRPLVIRTDRLDALDAIPVLIGPVQAEAEPSHG
jgi:hypothetical protein